MCVESVLLLQNVFSYYRMCSLIECVLLWNLFSYRMCSVYVCGMCSLIECGLYVCTHSLRDHIP
jgi:hypothetical protein